MKRLSVHYRERVKRPHIHFLECQAPIYPLDRESIVEINDFDENSMSFITIASPPAHLLKCAAEGREVVHPHKMSARVTATLEIQSTD